MDFNSQLVQAAPEKLMIAPGKSHYQVTVQLGWAGGSKAHTATIFTLVAFCLRTILFAVLWDLCASFAQMTLGFALTHPQEQTQSKDPLFILGLCHGL